MSVLIAVRAIKELYEESQLEGSSLTLLAHDDNEDESMSVRVCELSGLDTGLHVAPRGSDSGNRTPRPKYASVPLLLGSL